MTAEPRGENRDTAFARWWEADGRLLCGRIAGKWDHDPTETEKKIMEFGFRWGWMRRRDRDAKVRRKKR